MAPLFFSRLATSFSFVGQRRIEAGTHSSRDAIATGPACQIAQLTRIRPPVIELLLLVGDRDVMVVPLDERMRIVSSCRIEAGNVDTPLRLGDCRTPPD